MTLDTKGAGARSAGNSHATFGERELETDEDGSLERDTHPKGEKQSGLAGKRRSSPASEELRLVREAAACTQRVQLDARSAASEGAVTARAVTRC